MHVVHSSRAQQPCTLDLKPAAGSVGKCWCLGPLAADLCSSASGSFLISRQLSVKRLRIDFEEVAVSCNGPALEVSLIRGSPWLPVCRPAAVEVCSSSSVSFSGLILQLLLDPERAFWLLAASALPLKEVFCKLGGVDPSTTGTRDPEAAPLQPL